jgi:hypothetical protein
VDADFGGAAVVDEPAVAAAGSGAAVVAETAMGPVVAKVVAGGVVAEVAEQAAVSSDARAANPGAERPAARRHRTGGAGRVVRGPLMSGQSSGSVGASVSDHCSRFRWDGSVPHTDTPEIVSPETSNRVPRSRIRSTTLPRAFFTVIFP